MNIWASTAWVWPHVAASVATVLATGLLIVSAIAITRWRVRKHILSMLPQEAKDHILRSRRAAAHYRDLYERERVTSARLRATIRGSIGTAAATLQQLRGGDA